ncbi:MAG TPA: TylF/MycF/NovP-related O-methyltransferase [Puia sp.]|jgi:O-methyltransferase|nr:TylF/MycF/NovP-related O-methyltransferase [Puia sp.]
MKKWLIKGIRKLGYNIVRAGADVPLPADFDPMHREIYQKVKDRTMTSPERIYSLIEAVKYIGRNKISGAIVECGVWKGGSMMAAAETLLRQGDTTRELFLYDTFEGMSEPGELDKTRMGEAASGLLAVNTDKEKNPIWAYSALDTVKEGMKAIGYPETKVHYVRGKVEDTIPGTLPGEIAILRLDTDWYESTRHELLHLFPLLNKAGVLILDDYGHWQGARAAVDEYFGQHPQPILLNRIDETGRIAIKSAG